MLMLSVIVNVPMFGWGGEKRGLWEPGKRLKMGQFNVSMGPKRAEVCFFVKRATIPSKRVIIFYTFKAPHMHKIL